ncbi:protein ANTAGONIST OF LIKE HETEROCHROMATIN PROTEIN 1-like [Rhizophagus irregularis DAOM 181602=DAOM 197198]|nr:protein ANTAGONIST OF LIKE HETEROCHROMATIN PROTEIN 1-like [Rhizophagus irregularis DAOM 181602=DAOM 197198]
MQDFKFKRHFRLTKTTFEWLYCEIIPLLRRNCNEPGEKFGMGESTISYALRQFFDVIISKFLTEKIIFPTTESGTNRITNRFKRIREFSNIIGAIDGSHIPIKAPHLFPVDYFNRKGFYSIILQAVVDHEKKFLDICVGWLGSTHDSRILVNSDLYNKFENQNNLAVTPFHNKYFLGDEKYPNLSWLIVPYKDIGRGLTQEQTYFNLRHSQTRIKVEQAFGLLKGRWQCLLNKLEVSFEIVSHIVTTCCILHNICEERCDFLPPEERYHEVGTDANRELNATETSEGNAIRNSICNFFMESKKYEKTTNNKFF